MFERNVLPMHSASTLIEVASGPQLTAPDLGIGDDDATLNWSVTQAGADWLTLSLALAYAGGGSAAGWQAPKAGRAVYIDGKNTLDDLRDRAEILLASGGAKVPDRAATLGNLTILAPQAHEVGEVFCDLTNSDHQKDLVKLVRGKADVLVLNNTGLPRPDSVGHTAADLPSSAKGLLDCLSSHGVRVVFVPDSYLGQGRVTVSWPPAD